MEVHVAGLEGKLEAEQESSKLLQAIIDQFESASQKEQLAVQKGDLQSALEAAATAKQEQKEAQELGCNTRR